MAQATRVVSVPGQRRAPHGGPRLSAAHVVVVGMNYAPEPTGSAPYTTGLAEVLAEVAGSVEVLAGVPHYPSWRVDPAYRYRLRSSEQRNRVHVRRLRHVVPGRQSAWSRAAWEGSFLLNAALTRPRRVPDLVIASTPSLSGAVAGARLAAAARAPFAVVVQDLVGQAARQSGIAGGGAVAGLAARAERWALHRADVVAVVSDAFRGQLHEYGVPRERVRLLRNWAHVLAPRGDREQARRRWGWRGDDFVVAHTGNMGLKQDLGNVVEAARVLASDPSVRFVLVGDGNQRAALEEQAAGIPNLAFLDPVEAADYPDLLQAADLLLVNERPTVGDMSLPSKLTSYLAAGRPILAAVPSRGACDSELTRTAGAAVVVPAGKPDVLADAVRALAARPDALAAMAERGRAYAEQHLTFAAAAAQIRALAAELLQRRRQAR